MYRLLRFLAHSALALSKTSLTGRIVQLGRYTPFKRRFFSTFVHPNLGIVVGSGSSKTDWDNWAKLDPRYFIAPEDFQTEEEFDTKGLRDLQEHILSRVEINGRAKVLEIGCGIGRLLKPLAPLVKEAVGVDISPEMVRRARERLVGISNVQIDLTDGTLSLYADESFDMCFSYAVFQHIPGKREIQKYVEEAHRVLKPGGVFLGHAAEGGVRPKDGGGTWIGASFSEHEWQELLENYFASVRIDREVRDWMPEWCRNYLIGFGVRGREANGAQVRMKQSPSTARG